ncbi:acyl-CoA dehydrogenase family protein [Streptosporangium lutulentum]
MRERQALAGGGLGGARQGGWLGLAVPEEYGGGGQGLLELAVATETLSASGSAAALRSRTCSPPASAP